MSVHSAISIDHLSVPDTVLGAGGKVLMKLTLNGRWRRQSINK